MLGSRLRRLCQCHEWRHHVLANEGVFADGACRCEPLETNHRGGLWRLWSSRRGDLAPPAPSCAGGPGLRSWHVGAAAAAAEDVLQRVAARTLFCALPADACVGGTACNARRCIEHDGQHDSHQWGHASLLGNKLAVLLVLCDEGAKGACACELVVFAVGLEQFDQMGHCTRLRDCRLVARVAARQIGERNGCLLALLDERSNATRLRDKLHERCDATGLCDGSPVHLGVVRHAPKHPHRVLLRFERAAIEELDEGRDAALLDDG